MCWDVRSEQMLARPLGFSSNFGEHCITWISSSSQEEDVVPSGCLKVDRGPQRNNMDLQGRGLFVEDHAFIFYYQTPYS